MIEHHALRKVLLSSSIWGLIINETIESQTTGNRVEMRLTDLQPPICTDPRLGNSSDKPSCICTQQALLMLPVWSRAHSDGFRCIKITVYLITITINSASAALTTQLATRVITCSRPVINSKSSHASICFSPKVQENLTKNWSACVRRTPPELSQSSEQNMYVHLRTFMLCCKILVRRGSQQSRHLLNTTSLKWSHCLSMHLTHIRNW